MKEPKIVILLATYNGENFLGKQLNSILNQTQKNWIILASDDQSTDNTYEILKEYQKKIGDEKMLIGSAPRKGFVKNFLSLLENQNAVGDYYAFSDQDDIWDPNKLENSLKRLESVPRNCPALYCSRTMLINEKDEFIGYSPYFKKPPSFLNAIVQNLGGGNTMLFNHATKDLIVATKSVSEIISHDWWTYMLVSGANGYVYYDPHPNVRYRQHLYNQVGNNNSLKARFSRIQKLFQGQFKKWNDINLQGLNSVDYLLTEKNKKVIKEFILLRNQGMIKRIFGVMRLNIYRQTLMGNIGLVIAVIFNKI